MRICLASFGLEERNQRLQPWRYLLGAANVLARSGHEMHLVSDGYPHLLREGEVAGLPVTRLVSLRDWPLYGNPQVVQAVAELRPDIVLWHMGMTSFLRVSTLKRLPAPVIGILTSPVYQPRELLRLGFHRLLRGYRLSAIHLLGLLVPSMLIRRTFDYGLVEQLVVECETTRVRLIQRGVPGDRIHVVQPGIDLVWFEMALSSTERARVRGTLGFSSEDFVVGYFGPPSLLRGMPTLLRAVAAAQEREPRIRLLVLSRQRDGELRAEQRTVERLMAQLGAVRWTHVMTGFLPQGCLIQTVAACDVVVLPFEVVPSDVPLSVLEAMAMGMPVVTTQVVCLPELVPEGAGLCLPPGNSAALADAILTLADDAEMRQRLSRVGRRRAISWGAQDKSDDIWNRLLDGALLDEKGKPSVLGRGNDDSDNMSGKETGMPSVKEWRRRFYGSYKSPFERFNEKAKRLINENSIVLHAGCGADSSIGFRTVARATIGIDLDQWVLHNSDVDLAAIGNISHLPLADECLDFVASRWVLEHLRCPDLFMQETARVLRPGGGLLVLTPNLYHYFALAVKIVPHSIQCWFIQNVLGGDPDEVFPTFYRANTSRRIRSLAAQAGLVEEQLHMLEGAPSILRFSLLAYLAGVAYERMVNRLGVLTGFRGAILVIFRKPE